MGLLDAHGVSVSTPRWVFLILPLVLIPNLTVMSKRVNDEEKCVWFDECGPDPTPGRGSKTLNCFYDGEPGKYQ